MVGRFLCASSVRCTACALGSVIYTICQSLAVNYLSIYLPTERTQHATEVTSSRSHLIARPSPASGLLSKPRKRCGSNRQGRA